VNGTWEILDIKKGLAKNAKSLFFILVLVVVGRARLERAIIALKVPDSQL
jgi:hypothetical protein